MKKTLRVGLIGAGSVVREIYQYLFYHSDWSDILDIVAVSETDDEAMQWFCNKYNIPKERRFRDYREMLDSVELDVVQVNTPDTAHADPTVAALEAGCDVMLPKPLASDIGDAHRMIQTARRTGRLFGVDFHKREDPRTIAAAQRAQSGEIGIYQTSTWFMLDKILVSDPNHRPRFFASDDFVEKNSPLTFLSTHMLDTLLWIVKLIPAKVQARSWSQKLPQLKPKSAAGHDMVSLDVAFTNETTAHIVTGWHLPNAAWGTSVGETRLIFTDGMLDLDGTRSGFTDLSRDRGLREPNVLFKNLGRDGKASGFGISKPGHIYETLQHLQSGSMSESERENLLSPHETGFWVTAAVEAGLRSLSSGEKNENGIVAGKEVDVGELLREKLGDEADAYL